VKHLELHDILQDSGQPTWFQDQEKLLDPINLSYT
jgi:hypothetical protein